jgi:hypothetical protein
MYSNLRMQGGSNHLLLPTSLLHDARFGSRRPHVFAEGLVRVERSSSARVNALYPGEISSVRAARASRLRARCGRGCGRASVFRGAVAALVRAAVCVHHGNTRCCLNDAGSHGMMTQVHSRRARAMLRAAGHSGRQFNPAMGRVLGSWVLPPVDAAQALTRYTVPALEFRRMLAEAVDTRPQGGCFALPLPAARRLLCSSSAGRKAAALLFLCISPR